MHRRLLSFAALPLLLFASVASAQETPPSQSAGRTWLKEISPFLSPEDIAVGRVRLDAPSAKDSIPALQKYLAENVKHNLYSLGDLLQEQEILDGVTEIAFVVRSGDFGESIESFILLRLNGKVEDDKILALVLGYEEVDDELSAAYAVKKGNWLAVTNSETTTELLNEQLPFAPAKFADAADLLGDDTLQLIASMTGDTFYNFSETLPSPTVLQYYVSKLKFAAAGVSFAPQRTIRMALQFGSAEDATEARDWLESLTTPGNLNNPVASQIAAAFRNFLPNQSGNRLAWKLDESNLQQIDQLLAPAMASVKSEAQAMTSINNMKQIGLAFHNFHDTYLSFPPAQFPKDKDGKPLLSWRVYMLPYVGYHELFDEFRLDEPWDSEHNLKLADQIPPCYRVPGVELPDPRMTTYLLPQGKDAFWTGDGKSLRIRDFTDGLSNTIMAVQAAPAAAVIWTKPDDWQFNPQKPFQGLQVTEEGDFWALFCDGRVEKLSTQMKPEMMQRLIERNDGQVVELEEVEFEEFEE